MYNSNKKKKLIKLQYTYKSLGCLKSHIKELKKDNIERSYILDDIEEDILDIEMELDKIKTSV